MVLRQRAWFSRQYSTALYCQQEFRPCEAANPPQYGPSRVRPRSGEESAVSGFQPQNRGFLPCGSEPE